MVHNEKNSAKLKIEVIIGVLLCIILGILLFIYFQAKKPRLIAPTSRPAPSPFIIPLPTGMQSYTVSYGGAKNDKPKLSTVFINPLTPQYGEMQKISFLATSPFPLVKVTAILFTDKKKQSLLFTLKKGTLIDGEWSAQIPMTDTYNTIYKIVFHLANKNDVRDDEIVIR